MVKKLIELMRNGHYSYNDTNSYRNENGFDEFISDYVRYLDVKDLID